MSRTRGVMSIALIVAALVTAVLIAPIGSEQTPEPDPAPTIAPSQLRATDQRLLDAGRSAPGVGEPTPEIAFLTFEGTEIELHRRTRPVVLLFLDGPCTECEAEMSKLAVVAAVSSQDAWIAALATPAAGADVEQAYIDAGAAGLVYAGVDEEGAITRSFDLKRTPATVVLDGEMRVAAIWQRSIPAAVVTELIRRLLTTG